MTGGAHHKVAVSEKPSACRLRLLVWPLRCLAGVLVLVLTSPVLVPLVLALPNVALTRGWERFALELVRLIARILAVDVVLACPTFPAEGGNSRFIFSPWIRSWTSPLHSGYVSRTFDQPGRWMTETELSALVDALFHVARESMDELPQYGVFGPRDQVRDALSHRIVTIAYDAGGEPSAFTAMVYLPMSPSRRVDGCISGEPFVIHLGLTMIARAHRGRRIQSPVFTKCLLLPLFNQRRLGFTLTNIAASPAGVGAVCDYFQDTFPDYLGRTPRSDFHLRVARYVLTHFRHEFGCSRTAVFEPGLFVVRGSNAPEGGGASQFIKEDGRPVSRHRDERCNRFCAAMLDLRRGDEIFQVSRMHVLGAILRYRSRQPRPLIASGAG